MKLAGGFLRLGPIREPARTHTGRTGQIPARSRYWDRWSALVRDWPQPPRGSSRRSVSGAGFGGSGGGCEGDVVAEGLEPGDEPLRFAGRVGVAGVEVWTEVGVGRFGGEHMPDDHGQGVGDGDDGAFPGDGIAVAAEAQYQPVITGLETAAGPDR